MTDYSEKQDKQFDIIHETSVDFVLRPCAREVNIVQNDDDLSLLKVHLYRDSEPFKLDVSDLDSLTFDLLYARPNMTHPEPVEALYYSKDENNKVSVIYFPITNNMSLLNGFCKAVVRMTHTNQGAQKVAQSSPLLFKVLRQY